jgi:dolichyl-phosphate beta-glucosyltransferase
VSAPAEFLLVIPAFREAQRLPPFLRELRAALADFSPGVDILIVDDGSPEDDWRALENAIQSALASSPDEPASSCRLLPPLRLAENTCKGGAILAGWRHSASERWLAFVDADGAVPAREVRRVLSEIHENHSRDTAPGTAWFASRGPLEGSRAPVRRTPLRKLSSRVFAGIVRLLLGVRFCDSQCGFKVIAAHDFRLIDAGLRPHGFCFDLALLLALRRHAIAVREVAVAWNEQPNGHLSLRRHGPGILRALLALRREERTAAYALARRP